MEQGFDSAVDLPWFAYHDQSRTAKKRHWMVAKKELRASVLYIKILRQALEQHGFTIAHLLRDVSHLTLLEELGQDNKKLPLTAILDFWQDVAKLCDDPALGLHAGEECHLTNYGIFAHLLMNCPSLEEAMSLICSYGDMMNEAMASRIQQASSRYHYKLDFLLLHPATPQTVEFHFASIMRLGRELVARTNQSKIKVQHVSFTHAPTAREEDYLRIFGVVPQFEQSVNELIIPLDVIRLPTNAPNKGLFHMLLSQVNQIHQADRRQGPCSSRVHGYLSSEKEWLSWPTLQEVASSLGFSESTLKRKLHQEGTSFQEISDGIRYRRAKRNLELGVYSISEVGYRLGFTSAAAFGRAFKRWSGKTPGEYRRQRS